MAGDRTPGLVPERNEKVLLSERSARHGSTAPASRRLAAAYGLAADNRTRFTAGGTHQEDRPCACAKSNEAAPVAVAAPSLSPMLLKITVLVRSWPSLVAVLAR